MENEIQPRSTKRYNWVIIIGIIFIALSLTPFILAEFGGRFYFPDNALYMFFLQLANFSFLVSPLIAIIIGFAIYRRHKLNTTENVVKGNKLLEIIGVILAIIVLVTFVSWLVAAMGA